MPKLLPAPRPEKLARAVGAVLTIPQVIEPSAITCDDGCLMLIARPERRMGVAYWGLPQRRYGIAHATIHPPAFAAADARFGTMKRRGLVPLIGHDIDGRPWRSESVGWFAAVYDVARVGQRNGVPILHAHFALVVDEWGGPLDVVDLDAWLMNGNLPDKEIDKRRRSQLRG